jgi:hypothetical protein
MRKLFSLILIFYPFWGQTQTIKPSVFNMGGGFSVNLPVNAEWSIGEMAAIGSYLSGNIQFNAGILQPKTDLVTSILDIGSAQLGNQISISPNPSYDNIKMVFKMQKPGKATVSIINSASILYKRIDLGEIDLQQTKTIVLDKMPVGVYFFDVLFYPTIGLVQHGVFKIIRL